MHASQILTDLYKLLSHSEEAIQVYKAIVNTTLLSTSYRGDLDTE